MGVVTFGRALNISKAMAGTTDFERMTMDELIRDYQRTKLESFPTWVGFPNIETQVTPDGNFKVTWSAVVPKEILSYDPRVEDELWQL